MARLFCLLIFIFILCPAALAKTEKTNHKTSDADVTQLLIDESINNYSGNCPCPYNHAKNGSRCGKRSAYSRIGGESPLCYKSDISKEMIEAWRKEHESK